MKITNESLKETSKIKSDISVLYNLKKKLSKLNLNKNNILGFLNKIFPLTKVYVNTNTNDIGFDPLTSDIIQISIGDFESETVRRIMCKTRDNILIYALKEIENSKKEAEQCLLMR